MNDRLGYVLVALVLLAVVPQASNPPVWWLLVSLLIAIIGAWHLLRGAFLVPERPLQAMQHRTLLMLILTIPFVALVQALPVAQVLPAALSSLPVDIGTQPSTISLVPMGSLAGAVRVLAYVLFFVLVLEVAGQGARAERLGWILFFGIGLHAFWALIALNALDDFTPWGEKTGSIGSATGFFLNRNSFATFLSFGLVLGLALLIERARAPRIRASRGRTLTSPENLEMAAIGGLCLVMLITIFATQSRLGLTATFAGLAVTLGALQLKAGVRAMTVALQGGIALVVLLVLGVAAGGTGVIERAIFLVGAMEIRLAIYAQAVQMIAERPFLGWGLDAFTPAYEMTRIPGIRTDRVVMLAHSSYLTNWLELGLVFGSVTILCGAMVAVGLVRRLMQRKTHIAMPAAALGVLVVAAVHSTMDFSLEIPANTLAFLAIVGLGLARRRRADRPADS